MQAVRGWRRCRPVRRAESPRAAGGGHGFVRTRYPSRTRGPTRPPPSSAPHALETFPDPARPGIGVPPARAQVDVRRCRGDAALSTLAAAVIERFRRAPPPRPGVAPATATNRLPLLLLTRARGAPPPSRTIRRAERPSPHSIRGARLPGDRFATGTLAALRRPAGPGGSLAERCADGAGCALRAVYPARRRAVRGRRQRGRAREHDERQRCEALAGAGRPASAITARSIAPHVNGSSGVCGGCRVPCLSPGNDARTETLALYTEMLRERRRCTHWGSMPQWSCCCAIAGRGRGPPDGFLPGSRTAHHHRS
jgi:hypothetical protein